MNIRILGPEFLFTHADSVMQVHSGSCFSNISDMAPVQRACNSA